MGIFKKKIRVDLPKRRRGNDEPVDTSSHEEGSTQHTFQRNRTIAARPDTDKSPRVVAHTLTIKRRKASSVLIAILLVSAILYWLLSQFSAKVVVSVADSINIKGVVDNHLYEEAINNYLGANPFERFRFLLDRNNLLASLDREHPEVGLINDSTPAGSIGEAHITVSMRRPVASWTINDKKYFVDAKGIAFEKNYYEQPSVAIIDESGIAVEDGSPVASNRLLSFVGRAVALASDNKYAVTEAILPDGTTRQLEIRLRNEKPLIKLSLDRSVGEQIEDMVRSLIYLKSNSRQAEYIDVRVAGKVFYK